MSEINFTILQQIDNMLGNNNFRQFYAGFQNFPGEGYHISLQTFDTAQPNLFWNMPLFYMCQNFPTLWSQQSSNIATNHEIPPTLQLPQQQAIRKYGKQINRSHKKRRIRNSKKEIESAKKNSQSNIVNQMYSFFSSYEKSQRIVERAIRLLEKNNASGDRIKNLFYNIVRLINLKRGRKYVNRNSIINYYSPQTFQSEISNINQKLEEMGLITIEELCFLFRVITAEFIRTTSLIAILTSKRIGMIAKNEHLKRRRKILTSIFTEDDDQQ